jgi:hypothetical protein
MMDLRRRLPGLVRALALTRFGGILSFYADRARHSSAARETA